MTTPRIDKHADRLLWEDYATSDPMWAVLSDPSKRGRRWTLKSFFQTGAREISLLMHDLQRFGISPARERALDFGCGVGRLTLPLSSHFRHVMGVDVSPTMIEHARRLNPRADRVSYVVNDASDLRQFPSNGFDFIYSNIVLQHVPPELALSYVHEFFRLLAPGGLTVFQLPSHARPLPETFSAPVPMHERAYRAELSLASIPRGSWTAGAQIELLVTVTNHSPEDWDQRAHGALRVGNHWVSAHTGAMLVQDDGRSALPAVMRRGEGVTVAVTVTVPDGGGLYDCELDVVHEGISWFSDRGSRTLKMRVEVARNVDAAKSGVALPEPQLLEDYPEPAMSDEDFYAALPPIAAAPAEFPMNAVPFERVRQLQETDGVRLVRYEVDERSGVDFEGYRYFFQRAT
jgi:SAM-dependent methyltransferase